MVQATERIAAVVDGILSTTSSIEDAAAEGAVLGEAKQPDDTDSNVGSGAGLDDSE